MTDQGHEAAAWAPAPAQGWAEGVKRWLARELVAEAPPDLEEVMAQIPPRARWAWRLLVVAGGMGSWAAIIVGVAHWLR